MRFVDVLKITGLPPLRVTVLEPRLIVLLLRLEEDKLSAVTLKLSVVNVPLVIIIALVLRLRASPNVTALDAELKERLLKALPAVISVPVPLINTKPV